MKRTFVTGAVLALVLTVTTPVQAATLSEVLTRMDEIIKEMQKLRTEFDSLSVVASQSNSATSGGAGAVLGVSTSKRLVDSVAYGETNDSIALMQKLFRTDADIYPYGVVSGFFGPKTQEAVRNFQARFGLDTVGVVGPATTDLLEAFFAQYSDDEFPSDALAKKPQVLGASTSRSSEGTTSDIAAVQAAIAKLTGSTGATTQTSTSGSVQAIKATIEDGEASIVITYANGNKRTITVDDDDEDTILSEVADSTGLSQRTVDSLIKFDYVRSSRSSNDNDDGDAEDAIDGADNEIEDAQDEIDDADDDGDDVDWANDTLDEAIDLLEEAEDAYDDEDWDEAVEKADDAKALAKKAVDRIDEKQGSGNSKGDSDEIDSIEVEVDDGESEVTVTYDNGDDDYVFTIEEDKIDSIIEEVADELRLDERDVEDLIEFDFGRIDRIDVIVDEDGYLARVFYRSDVERRVRGSETDEDDILDEVADELDEDVEDIEDLVDFQ